MLNSVDKIIRSKRKTITLQITQAGKIILKAPNNLTNQQLNHFVLKHKNWIEKRLFIIKKRKPVEKKFTEGEEFLLFGKKIILNNSILHKIPKVKNEKLLLDCTVNTNCKLIIEKWYKNIALDFYKKRSLIYSKLLGVNYKKIKISNAKKRWGSCSTKGYINLSWRLVMAPVEIIDYVIVHELAHLIEPNHSKKFWLQVKRIFPDYKKRRKWLKDNGYLLNL